VKKYFRVSGRFYNFNDPDPVKKVGNTELCSVGVGYQQSKKLEDGTWDNSASMILQLQFWGKEAAVVHEKLNKGDTIHVMSGRVKLNKYFSKKEQRDIVQMQIDVDEYEIEKPQNSKNTNEKKDDQYSTENIPKIDGEIPF
jgi:single-stranded DNA-binding protein